mmetsp:Transcript_13494/g.35471  ORF Transcript_13494/g.35471 Transcript_13494/m.35471 type:complete len:666 (-) Transcript_13494:658-2655(-)
MASAGDQSGSTSFDENKVTDRYLASYLESRGYTRALEALKKEASIEPEVGRTFNIATDSEKSVQNQVKFCGSETSTSAPFYSKSYARLCSWVEGSIDAFKVELAAVLFPIFVHFYLELVAKGHSDEAKKMMEKYGEEHASLYPEELKTLKSVTNPDHISENRVVQHFMRNRFNVAFSNAGRKLLFSFLQDERLLPILRVVNHRIHITVNEQRNEQVNTFAERMHLNDDGEATEGDVKAVATMTGVQDGAIIGINAKELRWGRLKEEVEAQEKAKLIKEGKTEKEIKDEKIVDEVGKMGVEATRLKMPDVSERYPNVHLKEKEVLKELANAAAVSTVSLPSVAFYTLLHTDGGACCSRFSADARQMSAGFADSSIRVWNLAREEDDEGSFVAKRPRNTCLRGHGGAVYAVKFGPDRRTLFSSSEDGTARMWSLDKGINLVVYKGHNVPVWDLDVAPMGNYFATASNDRTARLWSYEHTYPLRLFAGHISDVDCVKFHPNGNYIATGSSDRSVRMWDVISGECVRLFTGHVSTPHALAFSPDGKTLATAGEDKTIILWDIASGRRSGVLSGHSSSIWSLDFNQEGTVLASGSDDEHVMLWDVTKAQSQTSAARLSPNDVQLPKRKGRDEIVKSPELVSALRTKTTPVHNVQFSQRNLLYACGPYSTP